MDQALWHGQRPDPCLDENGKLSILLLQQYCGYRNLDKNVKQQKALLLIVLRQLIKTRSSIENIAIAQLCSGALFFAMRSCEYLRTNIAEEKRRTKTLRIHNLCFFKKGRQIVHSDRNLSLAYTITLNFEFQKLDERHKSVTMHRSGDSTLCPVRAWGAIVH